MDDIQLTEEQLAILRKAAQADYIVVQLPQPLPYPAYGAYGADIAHYDTYGGEQLRKDQDYLKPYTKLRAMSLLDFGPRQADDTEKRRQTYKITQQGLQSIAIKKGQA